MVACCLCQTKYDEHWDLRLVFWRKKSIFQNLKLHYLNVKSELYESGKFYRQLWHYPRDSYTVEKVMWMKAKGKAYDTYKVIILTDNTPL